MLKNVYSSVCLASIPSTYLCIFSIKPLQRARKTCPNPKFPTWIFFIEPKTSGVCLSPKHVGVMIRSDTELSSSLKASTISQTLARI